MGYNQNNSRRSRRWISFLFPLVFLLIFALTQSLTGLFASLTIIVLLWVLIAAASSSSRTWNTLPMQPPPIHQLDAPTYIPEAETPYEQGYLSTGNTGGQAQQQATIAPLLQAYPYQPMPQGSGTSEESDRLAQLTLLGDLYHAGMLTDDEFTYQKQKILQASAVKEASEPEATPVVITETQYEEQPQVPYPQA